MCGVWPTTAFSLLPITEQRAFMAQLDGKSSTEISTIVQSLEGKEESPVKHSLCNTSAACRYPRQAVGR
jgi:hypothetical protein